MPKITFYVTNQWRMMLTRSDTGSGRHRTKAETIVKFKHIEEKYSEWKDHITVKFEPESAFSRIILHGDDPASVRWLRAQVEQDIKLEFYANYFPSLGED